VRTYTNIIILDALFANMNPQVWAASNTTIQGRTKIGVPGEKNTDNTQLRMTRRLILEEKLSARARNRTYAAKIPLALTDTLIVTPLVTEV
jgi:hypothetical protein